MTTEDAQGETVQYTLQSISTNAFKNPDQLMHNIMCVTEYLREIVKKEGGNPARETLYMLRTKTGSLM